MGDSPQVGEEMDIVVFGFVLSTKTVMVLIASMCPSRSVELNLIWCVPGVDMVNLPV